MTARVLVVDDIEANVKLLETRLRAEYFDVMTANNGYEALEACAREGADVVLLDVMMPGLDGFEVCRRLKADPKTRSIPVVMVTALDQPSDRIQGFEVGADDFLTKPVDDLALVTRVRNLARMKQLTDELVMRVAKSEQSGADFIGEIGANGSDGRILVLDVEGASTQRLEDALASEHQVTVVHDEEETKRQLANGGIDVVVVGLGLDTVDPLRFCSQIRSHHVTRQLPIIVLGEIGDQPRMLRALDIGVNDFVVRPVDRNELLARVRTQIKRRRFGEYLYRHLEERVMQAARDSLTGLFNRRHMEEQLKTLIEKSGAGDMRLSVILADIDHFKAVNDTYGHDAGDDVIRQFSSRLLHNVRRVDLVFRIGGEEFVVLLPKTARERAEIVAERLRAVIEDTPFKINGARQHIKVTTSIGVTAMASDKDSIESLLKRADEALYEAKQAGRNRIVIRAA